MTDYLRGAEDVRQAIGVLADQDLEGADADERDAAIAKHMASADLLLKFSIAQSLATLARRTLDIGGPVS